MARVVRIRDYRTSEGAVLVFPPVAEAAPAEASDGCQNHDRGQEGPRRPASVSRQSFYIGKVAGVVDMEKSGGISRGEALKRIDKIINEYNKNES